MNKNLSRFLLALGVLLVLAGLVLRFVLVPSLKVFPDDVDVTRHYSVEYLTLINAETLQFYTAAPGENPNLRIDRHVKVEAVDGNKTLVREDQILYDGDTALLTLGKYHALDRHTMEFLGDYPEDWAQHEGFWQREALTIGWASGVERKEYAVWSDDFRQTVPISYVGEEDHGGIQTYYFSGSGEPAPINPAQVEILGLPQEITIGDLATMASSIDVEGLELSLTQQLSLIGLIQDSVTAALGEPEGELSIPLNYLYDYKSEYWVEPVSGVLIDTRKFEHRAATFPDEVLQKFKELASERQPEDADYLPPDTLDILLPITVSEFVYQSAPASVEDARKDAEDARSKIMLFETYLPLALLVIGALVGLVGGYGLWRA